MTSQLFFSHPRLLALLVAVAIICGGRWVSSGEEKPASEARPADVNVAEIDNEFREFVQPLFKQYCLRCHNADQMKSGIRVDLLSGIPEDKHLFLWKDILKQVSDGAMPPEDEPQFDDNQKKRLTAWIQRAMNSAMARNTQRNGSIRRLTVSQYRNTLRDLLGLDEDLTEVLPPDAISKDGFANNGQSMVLSPLQVESYFDIAQKSLDLCIVHEATPPTIQTFRMDLGQKINPTPCPDNLILGANNHLLNNADFQVTEPLPSKPFPYKPFHMRTKYEFIEGYAGNDTVRGWRKYDSIYHSVFACMRGNPGYPKGEAFQVVPAGLLLRPAIPSSEIFGQQSTYGPMANFKISLRELPDNGNFRVTVKGARYDDALLLNVGTAAGKPEGECPTVTNLTANPTTTIQIVDAGIYAVDLFREPGGGRQVAIELGERRFAGQIPEFKKPADTKPDETPEQGHAFMLVRLAAGPVNVTIRSGDNAGLRRAVFRKVAENSDAGRRFLAFESRSPSIGVYLGLRRDCGSTLTRVGEPQAVKGGELRDYVFSGPINDFPSPDVETDNVNYLAGIREIGVRSEYTDGRDMPRLMIRSIEFEGPYYSEWPPTTHRRIFIDSPNKNDHAQYASEILRSFATRAFRRPVTDEEHAAVLAVWKRSTAEKLSFQQSIKDALLVVLTSPQFLFLIENSATPEPEDLDDYELASKLSYFLWNSAPDPQLLDLARKQELRAALDNQVDRMIRDPRFEQFMREFGSQWLSLDKFDVVSVDSRRYPKLTRDAKLHLRQEPVRFLTYLIEQNLSLRNIIHSDFILADEVVATYYNLGDRTESGFKFVPIRHENEHLGGILAQAGILAGLSDGREPNPIKRGAWVARKIVAEPPDDPPPNVPRLKEDDGGNLSLREKLERHRNQEGCVKCHTGIDPLGLPFEQYDAGGLFKGERKIDAPSQLPDGTKVLDLNSLKRYLAEDRIDQVTFSFLKHLSCYGLGRSLTYNELVFLQKECIKLRSSELRMQDLIRFVIKSDMFLKK